MSLSDIALIGFACVALYVVVIVAMSLLDAAAKEEPKPKDKEEHD